MQPSRVKLVEVGPRDGLQNEAVLPVATRLQLIKALVAAGARQIEAGSLVSAKRIPQMADSAALFRQLPANTDCDFPVLVANQRGLDDALALEVKTIAVFTSASDGFCQHNIGCSSSQSMARIGALIEQARDAGLRVRGYLSCTLGCPYQGEIPYPQTRALAEALYQQGCYEISLGDTIGVGTPPQALALFETVTRSVPLAHLAAHFHDTRGQALANLYALLQEGLTVIDAAVAGLGGCPYAPGASGNVATEDVLYLLQGLGIDTGVDLEAVARAGWALCDQLGHPPRSRVSLALRAHQPTRSSSGVSA